MKESIEKLIEDSIPLVKYRHSIEPSFLGLHLFNCSEKSIERALIYINSTFKKENNLNFEAMVYPNSLLSYENFYKFLYNKKIKKHDRVVIILERESELRKHSEIIRNCFCIDMAYFEK